MIPTRVIEKVLESGWRTDEKQPAEFFDAYEYYILDPAFWQALGKSCGWHRCTIISNENDYPIPHKHSNSCQVYIMRAQVFFELILTGGNTEQFWEEILPAISKGK